MEKKIGLVLEGGALRGLFTAGVLDVLMEKNIKVNGVIGVSAGAAFGCNYISAQPYRVLRYNLNYCKDPRYCSVRSLIKTGDLFGAQFCYHEIPERLDPFDYNEFDRSRMDFYVVGTDVVSGKPVYHRCENSRGDTLEWIRASSSMPLAARPVTIGARTMLDGGISDPIPLRFFTSRGYKNNIVVLTQPRDFQKERNSVMPAVEIKLRQYPNVIDAMKIQHALYNHQREEVFNAEQKGEALVICPPEPLPIHRVTHNPKKLLMAYYIGRMAAQEKVEQILCFLEGIDNEAEDRQGN